jgi:ankyrin repeat protein
MSAATYALLLIAGMNPFDHRNPLHHCGGIADAIRNGDVFHARMLLTFRPKIVNVPLELGFGLSLTPMQLAAEWNTIEVLKVLIEYGGDVNDQGTCNCTPLQLAARYGKREAAELLLKHGAVLDIFSAVALNKRDAVEKFFQLANVFGLAKQLANVSTSTPLWSSPKLLNWAVTAGRAEMAEFLTLQGADVNAHSSDRLGLEHSPLHEAAQCNDSEVIEVLLKHGAKVEDKDYDGFSPLHRAAASGNIRAAKVLLKHGARIDNREDYHAMRFNDNSGVNVSWLSMNTILHTVAAQHNPEMVALLLAHGADPNAHNANGDTPLDMVMHYAQGYDPKLDKSEEARRWKEEADFCIKLLCRYGGHETHTTGGPLFRR